jgi:tetratricopeptide (TPR) repeat protein
MWVVGRALASTRKQYDSSIEKQSRMQRVRVSWSCVVVLVVGSSLASSGLWAAEESDAARVANEIIGIVAESTPLESPLAMQARALRGLRTDVIGEMFSSDEGGDLTFSVLAAPLATSEGVSPIALFVEMDGASLLQFNQSDLARLEIYVYALGENQEIADYLAEVFAVDVSGLGERIWQSGLEFFGRLDLPPGSYELRVLVRNFQSRAKGLQILTLEVPDTSDARPAALTPLVSEPEARDIWVPVRSWRAVGKEAHDGYPLLSIGQNLNPAAQPVLVAGRECKIYIPAIGLPAGEVEGALQLAAAGDTDFNVVAESALAIESRAESGGEALEVLTVTASAPGVEPGSYLARVKLSGSEVSITSPSIDVVVVAKDTRERNLLWSDMRWLLGGARQAPAPDVVAEAPRHKRQAAEDVRRARSVLVERYRALVAQLADTPAETVRGLLFEFESEAVGAAAGGRLENLHQAELAVASDLARQHRDLIMPLVLLHEQMYERYRNRRLYTLLHHTRSLLEELADLFVDVGGGPKNGAKMLASLGGYLQESNLSGGSRRLYTRALEWDFKCAAALMGLASSLEKYGEYPAALDYLEQLILIEPDYHEGRLRLALNLERVGLRRRARELLESIVAGDASGWVGGIAYQELGRIMLEAGEVQRAAELLERAAEALPDERATLFLLGHAYDRLGRSNTALERLARVEPRRHARRSERWIYDQWPQAQLEAARSHLAAMSESVMADLPAALAAGGASK